MWQVNDILIQIGIVPKSGHHKQINYYTRQIQCNISNAYKRCQYSIGNVILIQMSLKVKSMLMQ